VIFLWFSQGLSSVFSHQIRSVRRSSQIDLHREIPRSTPILGPGPLMRDPCCTLPVRQWRSPTEQNHRRPSAPLPGVAGRLGEWRSRQKSKSTSEKSSLRLMHQHSSTQSVKVRRTCASIPSLPFPLLRSFGSCQPSTRSTQGIDLSFLSLLVYSKPNTIVFPVCQRTLPSRHSNLVGDRVAISRTINPITIVASSQL